MHVGRAARALCRAHATRFPVRPHAVAGRALSVAAAPWAGRVQLPDSVTLDGADEDDGTHVALMLSWVGAEHRQAVKYHPFFHQRNMPAITVLSRPRHVLFPDKAQALGRDLLDLLHSHDDLKGRKIVVYGFSVGGYMFSQLTSQLSHPSVAAFDQDRFLGCVWDSPIDYEGVRTGLPAAAAPQRPATQAVLRAGLHTFLGLANSTVTKHKAASANFHDTPVEKPSLLVYSQDGDPLVDVDTIETVGAKWRAKGMYVKNVKFDHSPHVQHLRRHPEAYTKHVNDFLDAVLRHEGDSHAVRDHLDGV